MADTGCRTEGRYYIVEVMVAKDVASADIDFRTNPVQQVPEEYSSLQIEIERTLTVLKVLFGEHADFWGTRSQDDREARRFAEYFEKLGDLALASLGQDQPRLGRLALTGLQNEVVAREGSRVKNGYIRRLGGYALGMGLLGTVIYFIFRDAVADHASIFYRFREFISMLVGSLLGTWLSFSLRRVTLGFFDLSSLEEDLLDPLIRLLFVGGLTTVVGLLFATQAVSVTIGHFDTAGFLVSGTVAVLIGCFCGIGEQGLSTAVARRASDFVGSIGGSVRPGQPIVNPQDRSGKGAADSDKANNDAHPDDQQPKDIQQTAGQPPQPRSVEPKQPAS